jgi:hypothetical protein
MVIEPREDLAVGAIGEAPMAEVGLPALVGQFGLEADIAGLGTLLRFRFDEPRGQQTAADRGWRHGHPTGGEMPSDSERAGVETHAGQLAAQVHDPFDHGRVRSGR